jgi:hypothetical protein
MVVREKTLKLLTGIRFFALPAVLRLQALER